MLLSRPPDREPTPELVRAGMHADLRAGQNGRCAAALAWLEERDRLIAADWMVRGGLEQLDGRSDAAIAALGHVDDRDPLSAQAHLMSGLVELERYRARPAEAALLKALARDPGQKSARLELIRLYSRQQRFAELDRQFDELAERNLLDFEYVRFWFMTRNAPWEAKEDIEILQHMVKSDPEDRWSRVALAEGLRRLARPDEARKILEPLPSTDADGRAVRAWLAIDRGDLECAEELAALGPPDHPRLAQLRGQLALKRDDAQVAVRYFQQAYAAAPDDRVTLAGLATALKLNGQSAAAEPFLAQIRRFDELAPLVGRITAADAASDGDLHRRLGSICEAIGRRA